MHVGGLTDAERRCNDGTERNWIDDLVLGSRSENAKEAVRQRNLKRAREEEQKQEQDANVVAGLLKKHKISYISS